MVSICILINNQCALVIAMSPSYESFKYFPVNVKFLIKKTTLFSVIMKFLNDFNAYYLSIMSLASTHDDICVMEDFNIDLIQFDTSKKVTKFFNIFLFKLYVSYDLEAIANLYVFIYTY